MKNSALDRGTLGVATSEVGSASRLERSDAGLVPRADVTPLADRHRVSQHAPARQAATVAATAPPMTSPLHPRKEGSLRHATWSEESEWDEKKPFGLWNSTTSWHSVSIAKNSTHQRPYHDGFVAALSHIKLLRSYRSDSSHIYSDGFDIGYDSRLLLQTYTSQGSCRDSAHPMDSAF